MTRRQQIELAAWGLVAGLCLAFSLPPFGLWPLAILGYAILTNRVADSTWLRGLILGAIAGVVMFAVNLAFVSQFTLLGAIVLVLLQALAIAVPSMLAATRHRGALVLAGGVVLTELLRTSVPFGGVGAASMALGQVNGPFGQAGRIGGPLAILLAIALVGCGIGSFASKRPDHGRGILMAFSGVGLALAGTIAFNAGDAGAPIAVTCVQGGGARGVPYAQANPQATTAHYLRTLASLRRLPYARSAVILPEDAITVDGRFEASAVAHQLSAEARRLSSTVFAGVRANVSATAFDNLVVVFGPGGTYLGAYEKIHRVPFGEYVPLRSTLSQLFSFSAIPQEAIPGKTPGIFATPAGIVGVLTSYEAFYPDLGRAVVRGGAQYVVIPTNTASYRTDQVTNQEVAAAQVQAISLNRTVVLCSTVGRSAFVGPKGNLITTLPVSTAWAVAGVVVQRHGERTPFVDFGALLVVVLASALVLGGVLGHLKR